MSNHPTRDAYVAAMKAQLDELNAKMTRLDARAEEAKLDARAKYKEEMAKLRHQSDLASAKFDEMKAASESSWDAMVAQMDKVRDAWLHSFHYFKAQL